MQSCTFTAKQFCVQTHLRIGLFSVQLQCALYRCLRARASGTVFVCVFSMKFQSRSLVSTPERRNYQCSGSTSPDESCSPKKKLRYKQTSPQIVSLANKTHNSVSVPRLQLVFKAKLLHSSSRLQCVVPHQHTDKREVTVCDGIRPELAVGLAVLILPGDFGQQRKNQAREHKGNKSGLRGKTTDEKRKTTENASPTKENQEKPGTTKLGTEPTNN